MEGIDGIIEDGKNGFLCNSGDIDELSSIIEKIKNLPLSELENISFNAKKTALQYSDKEVAINYLNNLKIWEQWDIWKDWFKNLFNSQNSNFAHIYSKLLLNRVLEIKFSGFLGWIN